ncbi:MAG: DNA polymerase III subunit delta [Acidobacteriota bacterium]|nr:DNA polymerase III subunit delta [Acidobacteriota bacterium]
MAVLAREDLRNQLKRGEIAPVYLLFGDETYLRDLAAKIIADRALSDSSLREFNETVFSLADSKIEYALSAAEQMPMISSRRVVRITEVVVSASGKKETLKEDDEAVLMRYLARPSETSVVIFVADELDKRRKISKLLLDNCVSVEFTPLSDNELIDEVKKQLKKSNAQIEDRAARQLIGLVGNDLQKLMTETEKLATAALPDSLVTFELVEELVPNSRELSNFELTDYLLAKNRTRALQILHKILDDGAEPLMLLGLIANNFHRLFLAKELMRNGVDRTEVARTMRLPFGKQEEFLATARRADAERLAWNLKRIAQADLAIKTSQATPRLQIEMLVCELTK